MGAVTLLVAIVAVFLSYNANSGLPFVPTTRLVFESPNGAALTAGNQVREGGRRVGSSPISTPFARRAAGHRRQDRDQARRLLRRRAGDSTVAIRPLSLSGLKYVELTRGESRRGALRRATRSRSSQARVPVQLDDLGNMYNAETRQGVRDMITGAGNALAAARRSDQQGARRPAASCCATSSRWHARWEIPTPTSAGFLDRLGRTAEPWRPRPTATRTASRRAPTRWRRGRETRAACARRCSEGPRTLGVGIPSLRVQRPFLEHVRRDLDGAPRGCRGDAARRCRGSSRLSTAASRCSRKLPRLYRELKPTLVSLEQLMTDRRHHRRAPRGHGHGPGPASAHPLRGPAHHGLQPLQLRGFANAERGRDGAGARPGAAVAGQLRRAPTNGRRPRRWAPGRGGAGRRAARERATRPRSTSGQRRLRGRPARLHRRVATSRPRTATIVIDPVTPGNQGPNYTGRPPRAQRARPSRAGPRPGPAWPRGLGPMSAL